MLNSEKATYESEYKNFKTDYLTANPVSFGSSSNSNKRIVESSQKIAFTNTTDQAMINSKNLNLTSLFNYCRMGTLKERVFNMLQEVNLYVRNDSNTQNKFRNLVEERIKTKIEELRKARALDNLK